MVQPTHLLWFCLTLRGASHYIKNSKTKRAEALLPLLRKARRLVLLSGTPALSRPEELYTQLDALRPGVFGSWTAFAKRYCNAHHGRFGWDTKVSIDIRLKRFGQGISHIRIFFLFHLTGPFELGRAPRSAARRNDPPPQERRLGPTAAQAAATCAH